MIDIEEAKYQEQKRKEAIEKAKTQLYYQTDRVKGLHVSITLSVDTIAAASLCRLVIHEC